MNRPRSYTLTPEDRAYILLAQKEGMQAALQRMMLQRQQMPDEKLAFKSLKDFAPGERGRHIAEVVRAYPGLPLKEALKRFAEKSALPPKAALKPAPVTAAKPSATAYPEIKVPKFPAMKFAGHYGEGHREEDGTEICQRCRKQTHCDMSGQCRRCDFETANPEVSPAEVDAWVGKTALDLQFNSQEEAQQHNRLRGLGGAAGGLVGAGLGGMMAGKRFGLPGAIAGGVAGSLLGGAPGKLMADVAHDIPQRTRAMYDQSMGRMGAAGGESIRLAMDMLPAAAPSVTEFLEFAEADHSVDEDDLVVSGFEEEMLKRLKPMGLGDDASLEGGDVGQRTVEMGLPKYDGV